MQDARAELGRPAVEATAKMLAEQLAARWNSAPASHTPVKFAGVLLADLPDALMQDPWNRDFALELSSETGIEPGSPAVLATIRSDGPDGEAGTRDDIELVLRADGSVADG